MGARTADGRVVDTDIGRGIDGLDAVAIAGGGGEARIAITVRGRGSDLHEARAARPLAALHLIAGDADIIGSGGPAEVDLRRTHRGSGQAGDIAGGRRVGCPDRRRHVSLNLGLREHAVVDADFVDQAWEEFRAVGVATEAQRRGGGLDRAGGGGAAHQPAVDVELNLRTVIRGGDVGPGIGNQGGGGIAKLHRAAQGAAAGWPVLIRAGRQEIGIRFFLENGLPAREGDGGVDPGLQGHGRREIQRGAGGDQHQVVDPVKTDGGAEFPRGSPDGAVGQGAGVGVA